MRSRRNNNSASAILCADVHLRSDIPIGRIDNYSDAMFKKLSFILNLSKEHNCPILVAGDLGNKPSSQGWPPWLFEKVISLLKGYQPLICIPGQHDLPNHQLEQWKESGIGVLHSAGVIKLLTGEQYVNQINNFSIVTFPYGFPLCGSEFGSEIPTNLIAMTHQMIIEDKELWPGQIAPKGNELLRKFPEYSLILSGDNHIPFVCEYEGRFLVNPGSMMRNTTTQQNHKPRVYLWYAEEKRVEPVFLPIQDNVFDLQYIEQQEHNKDKEQRFEALIERVKEDVEVQLSFEGNLQQYFEKNRTEQSVVDKVWKNVK